MGTPENSAVSLWEIAKWTNMRLDTFVNFQRLPDLVDDGTDDDRLAARSCVVGEEGGNGDDDCVGFQPPTELSSMTKYMNNAYLVSSDATKTKLAYGSSLIPIFPAFC